MDNQATSKMTKALANSMLRNLEVVLETDGGNDSTITFTHKEVKAIVEALSAPASSEGSALKEIERKVEALPVILHWFSDNPMLFKSEVLVIIHEAQQAEPSAQASEDKE